MSRADHMSLAELMKESPPPKNCKWLVKVKWGDGERIHSYFMYEYTAERFVKFANEATGMHHWVEEVK